jgi:hypothetical protein
VDTPTTTGDALGDGSEHEASERLRVRSADDEQLGVFTELGQQLSRMDFPQHGPNLEATGFFGDGGDRVIEQLSTEIAGVVDDRLEGAGGEGVGVRDVSGERNDELGMTPHGLGARPTQRCRGSAGSVHADDNWALGSGHWLSPHRRGRPPAAVTSNLSR